MAPAKKMSGQSTRPRRRAAAAAVRPSAGPIRSGNTDAIRSPFVRTQQRNHCVRGLPAGAAAAAALAELLRAPSVASPPHSL